MIHNSQAKHLCRLHDAKIARMSSTVTAFHVAVSIRWRVLVVSVLLMRALLLVVQIRAPEFSSSPCLYTSCATQPTASQPHWYHRTLPWCGPGMGGKSACIRVASARLSGRSLPLRIKIDLSSSYFYTLGLRPQSQNCLHTWSLRVLFKKTPFKQVPEVWRPQPTPREHRTPNKGIRLRSYLGCLYHFRYIHLNSVIYLFHTLPYYIYVDICI